MFCDCCAGWLTGCWCSCACMILIRLCCGGGREMARQDLMARREKTYAVRMTVSVVCYMRKLCKGVTQGVSTAMKRKVKGTTKGASGKHKSPLSGERTADHAVFTNRQPERGDEEKAMQPCLQFAATSGDLCRALPTVFHGETTTKGGVQNAASRLWHPRRFWSSCDLSAAAHVPP